MKVLFIGSHDFNSKSGGGICSKRNYDAINTICGIENVIYLRLTELDRSTFLKRLYLFYSKLFRNTTKEVLKLNNVNQFDIIYIDTSYNASLINKIRKIGFRGRIIVFFHNCEYDFRLSKKNKLWKGYVSKKIVINNEMTALKYADYCIFLNERDLNREREIYGLSPKRYIICPMTFHDCFHGVKEKINRIQHKKTLYTFLGSYFPANVRGIKWFMKEVLPYVNIQLRIIGNGMEKLKDEIDCSCVELIGGVDNLEAFLLESDYMLFPILDGSGMKIKTCEALMYAKNIIGTPEAFSGYDIPDYKKIGACCYNSKDFIYTINNINMPRYNKDSREIFLKYYSFESGVEKFRTVFEKSKS